METKNTGVLAGMCCPECRKQGPFDIEVPRWVTVYDSGDTDEDSYDTGWKPHSRCRCSYCRHLSTVAAFGGYSRE